MVLLIITLVFLIIGAIVAIETRNLLSSVISVGAVGFGLSVMFLLLGAPDLAITQMVVEVLALVVLVRGTLRVDLAWGMAEASGGGPAKARARTTRCQGPLDWCVARHWNRHSACLIWSTSCSRATRSGIVPSAW